MGRVQRARARARTRRAGAAARAAPLPRDLLVQPRRVLHGARRRPARVLAHGHGPPPGPRRADDRGGARRDRRADRPADARADPPARRAPTRARAARHADRDARGVRRRGAGRALGRVPGRHLPRPDSSRRRARTSVPVHLEPLALARRARARPAVGRASLRTGEGAGGAPAVLARRRGRTVPAARAADRGPPRHAVPRHGDRGVVGVPRDTRR